MHVHLSILSPLHDYNSAVYSVARGRSGSFDDVSAAMRMSGVPGVRVGAST